jgi:hypothetical protein
MCIHSYGYYLEQRYTIYSPERPVLYTFKYSQRFPAVPTPELEIQIQNLSGLRIQIKAGEITFIPSGWWHAATNISETVAWGNSIINFSNINKVILAHFDRSSEFKDTLVTSTLYYK